MKNYGAAWAGGAVVVLLGVGLVSAAFGPREPECEWQEQPARDQVSAVPSRLHLDDDLRAARAEAEGFSKAVAERPLLSESIDAEAGALTAPARALAWCSARLESQIAAVHGLQLEQVRHPAGDEAGGAVRQADADRASGAAPVSSVVSRPSR